MEYKPETKECQNCKKDFIIEPEDFSFYEKISSTAGWLIPSPSWCPDCRFQRRCLFRNERKLFRNLDAITGKEVISLFPKEASFPIYEDKYWWSDKWDPFSYGIDFDRNKPFLAQFLELSKKVPIGRSSAVNMVNSDYSVNAADLKNCYLIVNATATENSAYGNAIDYCKDCFDNSHLSSSERCYGSFWLSKCYETHFSVQCENCVSVYFSKNCSGCNNCFGCVNLRNKSYCFFNKQLTKEEYIKTIKNLKISKWSNLEKIKKETCQFWINFPVKYIQGVKNYNCTGEYISNSKNINHSYLIRGGENLKYVSYAQTSGLKDSMDLTVGGLNSELIFESTTSGWKSSQIRFCVECWNGGMDFEYSMFCGGKSNHVFGSVAIKSGEYVILNKKYKKEEFYRLRDEIRQHMDDVPYTDSNGRVYKYGEFFPPEFSPFAYNDTIATEHFPLSEEQIISYGARWYEISKNEYDISIRSEDLPDDICETSDDILKEVISCQKCNRAYKIIFEELQFLKQLNLPLPRLCVDCRHAERIFQRNKSKFYKRKCMKKGCTNEFETSYAPDRPEIVYCEKCYQQEVY
jgi:hypothetical protein